MTRYLFFDTETTGLNRRSDHVVQIAWILANDSGDVVQEECHVIQPKGYSIPFAASNVHGITTDEATKIGKPLFEVLARFSEAASQASVLVAHNIAFDYAILQNDYKVAGLPFPLYGKVQVCTMKLSTSWCRLPKLNGALGFKYPRLDELYWTLFGEGFDGAHDALSDTRACMKSYFGLVSREIISKPRLASIQQPGSTVEPSKNEEMFLQFPEGSSCGTVYLDDGVGIYDRDAKGRLIISRNWDEISLAVNENVSDFSLLSHCDPQCILHELDVRASRIADSDLLFISKLHSLKVLELRLTKISGGGFLYLRALCQLEFLSLQYCRELLDISFRHLETFSKLKKLALGESSITDEGVKYLGSLSRLEELYLWKTSISNSGLQYLSELANLKKLNLSRTAISDEGVAAIENLGNLQELNLELTNVSARKKCELREKIPNCYVL